MKQLLVEALALPCLSWVCFSYSVVCSTSLLAATTACTASRLVDRTTLCKKQTQLGQGRAGQGRGGGGQAKQGGAGQSNRVNRFGAEKEEEERLRQ